MNKIKITVEGPSGSGKTAISEYIKKMLCKRGIDTSFTDTDSDYVRTKEENKTALRSISSRCEVTIEEKQAPRSGS